jgi:hypothetical protein
MNTNAPESASLTRDEMQVFEAARSAVHTLTKTFEMWITIARGVQLARAKADRIGSRGAFQLILEQQAIAPALGSTWNSQKACATKLLRILERLPEIEAWRATLSETKRIQWGAPSTVYTHCPIFKTADDIQAKKDAAALKAASSPNTPSPKLGDLGGDSDLEAAHARIRELEADLATARADRLSSAVDKALDQQEPANAELLPAFADVLGAQADEKPKTSTADNTYAFDLSSPEMILESARNFISTYGRFASVEFSNALYNLINPPIQNTDATDDETDDESEPDYDETAAIKEVWSKARKGANTGGGQSIAISALVARVVKMYPDADLDRVEQEMRVRCKRARGITWVE